MAAKAFRYLENAACRCSSVSDTAIWLAVAIVFAVCLKPLPASAATATATFNAQIIIQSSCQIQSPTKLDFGSQVDLAADVDQTSTFDVQCSNGTAYSVGLNAGTTSGGTTTTRRMSSGPTTIDYKMFRDSARTSNWGNAIGTDTLSGTGNGSAQTITIYGRVPAQATPLPGTYTDTVTITVSF